jgi:hypothetical protein
VITKKSPLEDAGLHLDLARRKEKLIHQREHLVRCRLDQSLSQDI